MNEYGEVYENVDLKKYNTYGIGGISKYVVFPNSVDDLRKLLEYLNSNNIPWYILGKGSNVILPDDNFEGAIIKLDKLNSYKVENDIITVEAGISLSVFIQNLLKDGYTNYANLFGIPGLLGGAIIGNAGAYGTSIFDNLLSVTIIDSENKIRNVAKENIDFSYRYTEFKNKKNIIVEAQFQGIKGDVLVAKKEIADNLAKRKSTQPLEYKNAGSVFKNPPDMAAGKLIEQAGLKGTSIGGAKVSLKHANFIINFNNAKSRDIIDLIELIKREVHKKFNVELQLEQIRVIW